LVNISHPEILINIQSTNQHYQEYEDYKSISPTKLGEHIKEGRILPLLPINRVSENFITPITANSNRSRYHHDCTKSTVTPMS